MSEMRWNSAACNRRAGFARMAMSYAAFKCCVASSTCLLKHLSAFTGPGRQARAHGAV